jgi:inner membrane protein
VPAGDGLPLVRRMTVHYRDNAIMPTVMTHAVIGLAAGAAFASPENRGRLIGLSVVCSILPDADVIGFKLGIPYAHPFGHRGFFHSLFFALFPAVVFSLVFFRREPVFSRRWWGITALFFALTASHCLLDAFTRGGLGPALLAPFDNTRYVCRWTPFEASPIGIKAFFHRGGLDILAKEALLLWLPVVSAAFCIRLARNSPRSLDLNSEMVPAGGGAPAPRPRDKNAALFEG